MASAQVAITPDELGKLPDTFGGPSKFHGVFIQIAHEGQEPKSDEPGFRILRFCDSKQDFQKSRKALSRKLAGTGNILYHTHNGTTLICKDLDRQVDPGHVTARTHELKEQCINFAHFRDEDWVRNRLARRSGKQDEARKMQDEFIDRYNQKGWVKLMRRRLKIAPEVRVVPGMHHEAEEETRKLAEAAASAAAAPAAEESEEAKAIRATLEQAVKTIKPPEPAAAAAAAAADDGDDGDGDGDDGDEEDEFERAHALPDGVRRRGQLYAAVSFVVEDGDDLETLLFIHGVYASEEAANEHMMSDLNTAMWPMTVNVVNVGEWIQPVQMLWNDSMLSKRVEGLTETNAMMLAQKNQEERAEAIKRSRQLKGEVERKKNKAMDESVVKGLCDRLKLSSKQLAAIMDAKDYGTDAVIALCNEKDEAKRAARIHDMLSGLGLLEAEAAAPAAAAPEAAAPEVAP